jgi:hypothetical protein
LLYISKSLRFLDLIQIRSQTAESIVSVIVPIVDSLKENKVIVTAICTNNASNEKASLNPKHDFAIQNQFAIPIFRVPCLAHTANLAIEDALKEFGEESLYSKIQFIISNLSITS